MLGLKAKTVLPFYTDLSRITYFKDFCRNKNYALLNSRDRLLPFQFYRSGSPNGISDMTISIKCIEGDYTVDITSYFDTDELAIITVGDSDVIIHYGKKDLLSQLPCGYYYILLNDGCDDYYSEIIQVIDYTIGSKALCVDPEATEPICVDAIPNYVCIT